MRTKIFMAVAAAALLTGPFGAAATAQAAQSSGDTTTYNPTPTTAVVQPLSCYSDSDGCPEGSEYRNDQCYSC